MTSHGPAKRDDDADVIVVGAGPSGSMAAYYLAQAGLNVLLIEKSRFPRDKVCGDGLTPRAVKSLVAMGVDVSEEAGWLRNKGLRVIGSKGAGSGQALRRERRNGRGENQDHGSEEHREESCAS